MNDELLVLVPSRGRPGNVERLAAAWDETQTGATLWVCLDDDDPLVDEYMKVAAEHPCVLLLVAPRMRLGGTLNYYAVERAGDFRWVGFMGDDHLPRTLRWDEEVTRVLADLENTAGYGMVYGDDLFQGENLPTAVFMSGNIPRRLHFIAPPGQTHLYLDDFWKALGIRLGCLQYLPEVVIEHMHPAAGKADTDATYDEANSISRYALDRAHFDAYLQHRLAADVNDLLSWVGR